MSDYIKREDVYDAVQAHYDTGVFKSYEDGQRLMDRIKAIPAADVVDRKRGKWVKMDMHRGPEQYKCSVCRSECYVPKCMGEPMYAYCPNCGADMREES